MSDIQIAGATYTDVPSIQVPKVGGGFATYTEGGGTMTLKMGVLRPDATVVKTISYDKHIVADEEVTIPAYSTSSQTLIATSDLSEDYTMDYANYNYYILQRTLTIPEYSVSTKAKGRLEYAFSCTACEVAEIPGYTFKALLDGTTTVTSRSVSLPVIGAFNRLVHWSGGSAIAAYSSASYGTAQTIQSPTISNGVLMFNSPIFFIRGHATYLSSTYYSAITDIRYQYVIEVWRAPKSNLNLDGWGQTTQARHIISCAQNANHKLT